MPRVINVSVNGEFISKDNSVGGVQGEGNATNIHLVFDASWAGYGKRVIWRNAQGEDPVAVILTHSPEEMAEASYDELVFDTPIPTEPMKLPGWCTFTIEGYKDDDVKAVALTVSDSLKVIFNDSFYAPGEPTPSQADQIMAEIAKIEPQMEAFAKEAKSWAVGGTGSREGEDTDNAKYYAGQAKQSAQDAAGSAGAAEASAEAAKDSENASGASAGAAASSAAAAASSAGAASQSASAASGSAGSAAGSAQEAKDSASAAKASETASENAKLAAEQAKSNAENSASAAKQSKVSAENSKNIAAQKATEAGESAVLAENAKTGAEQAKEGAEEAQRAIENMLVEAITLATGQPATVTKSLVNQVVKLTFGLPRGEKGETGTKGEQGVGITSVERTSGTGAPGTKDTYTISLSDGSSYTFQVYNGANGAGSGDLMADGSVPMSGNLQMGGNRVTGLGAPQEDGDAARKADLSAKQNKLTGSVGQIVGFDSDGNAVAQDAPESGGKRIARFTVGTSTAGWTSADCDYLCDGTDDQEEINAAIQALPSGGGQVVVLDGTYNITATIAMSKDNVKLSGNGAATVLKRMWDNSSSVEGVITVTAENGGCCIENLQIDGNKTDYTADYNNGICLRSSNNIVTGIISNDSYSGIYVNVSNNNTITGNTCNNNDSGIYVNNSNNNTITGNSCNNSETRGIFLNYGSGNNTITGNTCDNNSLHGVSLNNYSSNNTISGNTCNDNKIGIFLIKSSNNTITGNTCIRGAGLPSDYTSLQETILIQGAENNYNLVVCNNIMGKDVTVAGGTGNSIYGNKWTETTDVEDAIKSVGNINFALDAINGEVV